jgi:Flp pilus assembly protein TadD/cell division septation protein DedD
MIPTRFVKLAVSGLALGLSLTGGHAGPSTHSESASEAKQMKIAVRAAVRANKLMTAQDFAGAVTAAETAVTYQPRDPSYRLLLGQAYLSAGRFAAAETSFSDTLTLMPDNSRAALNLALTEIAQGKRDAALSTLADYREKMAAADYGLAVGLAGDTENAMRVLEAAVRGGVTDPKTRQNLALVYALAGKWSNARVYLMQDLTTNDADARIVEWMHFVKPTTSYDQVASLLGVSPARDAGQPTRLALNGMADTAVASADPVAAPAVVQPMEATVVAEQAAAPQPAAFETTAPTQPSVVLAERHEIVQPLPAPVIQATTTAAKQRIVPVAKAAPSFTTFVRPKPRSFESGKFVVQLGAFENAAVSRDAWRRLSSRYSLTGFDPANSAARVGGANYVRLSVGGFVTRAEANGVCTRIRNAGGRCFVRGMLGDAPAQWVQRGMPKMAKPIRVASR